MDRDSREAKSYKPSRETERTPAWSFDVTVRDDEEQLPELMNALASEMAGLNPNDPRRTEIVKELSRLSLLLASMKGRNTDG